MPEMTSTLPEVQRAGILPILLPETLREGPPRSRCAEIGYLICPRTNIVIQDESSIEHHCILFCYSDPSIERVFTNSARIRYTNEADEVHHHTLDIRAKRFDGYIYGLLAKPDSRAVSIDLRTFTKRLSEVTPKSVADELNYVTERDFPEYEIRNASAIHSCRREKRTGVDTALAEMAHTIAGDISIADLCNLLGGGRVAFRPVVRAIFYGTLSRMTDGLIEPSTIVRFSGEVKPDFDARGPLKIPRLSNVDGSPPKSRRPKSVQKRHSHRAV